MVDHTLVPVSRMGMAITDNDTVCELFGKYRGFNKSMILLSLLFPLHSCPSINDTANCTIILPFSLP